VRGREGVEGVEDRLCHLASGTMAAIPSEHADAIDLATYDAAAMDDPR